VEEAQALKKAWGKTYSDSSTAAVSAPVVRRLGVLGTFLERGGWAGSAGAVQGPQLFIIQCFIAN